MATVITIATTGALHRLTFELFADAFVMVEPELQTTHQEQSPTINNQDNDDYDHNNVLWTTQLRTQM